MKSIKSILSLFMFVIILGLGANTLLAEVDKSQSVAVEKKIKILTLFTKPVREDAPQPGGQIGLDLRFKAAAPELQNKIELIHHQIPRAVTEMATEALLAIQRYRPDLIIGGTSSNQAFVISDLAESMGIPYITTSATHPALTKNKRTTFRVCFDDNYQAAKLADFVFHDLGLKKGLVIYNRSETFSVGVQENFNKRFQDLGGKVLESVAYEKESELGPEQLLALAKKHEDAEFAFLPNYQVGTAAVMSKMIGVFRKDMVYIGPDSWNGSSLIQSVIAGSNTQVKAYFVEHWSAEYESKSNKEFVKLLNSKNLDSKTRSLILKGQSRSAYALGFDAMSVALEAVSKIDKRPTMTMLQALREVSLDGSTGPIIFEEENTPDKGLFIYSFQSEGRLFVKAYR